MSNDPGNREWASGFCRDLVALVDYDHLSQAVEAMPQSRFILIRYGQSGFNAEVVVDRLRLVWFQAKARVISVRAGQIVPWGQHNNTPSHECLNCPLHLPAPALVRQV